MNVEIKVVMNRSRLWTSLCLVLLFLFSAKAQDTLILSRAQCETIFLKENLLLIAERLQISQAEAMVMQARLWPNPSVEIDELNLWATRKQLDVFGDDLQGFGGGSRGRNQQISASVEQLVLTAGKRRKLVALEQVTVEKAGEYFEDLLRNLKTEFRNQLTQLQYLQFSKAIYERQIASVGQLTRAYQRQVEQGNVPKGEYIRLKALELEISRQMNALEQEMSGAQKELRLFMHLPASIPLRITDEGYLKDMQTFLQSDPGEMLAEARKSRPDFRLAELEQTYYARRHTYERAQRVPDLTLKGGYDRGGNFMYNFVGFGIGIDLPVFNRNQGNIRQAHLGLEQARILYSQKELSIEHEVALAYQNLNQAIRFYGQIEPGYEDALDELLGSYTRNFASRNISLLEYLDFMEAYLENKKIILEAAKSLNEKAELWNYTIGKDIIK